jgi:hypothetical protein
MKARAFLTAALAGLALLTPLHGRAQAPAEDKWTFSLMPYLWLPNFSGKFNYGPPPSGGVTANVTVDANTILSDLDFAFMIAGEARRGRWLVGTDFIYLDLSSDNSQVKSVDFNPGPGPVNVSTTNLNAGTQSSLKGTVWTAFGGYAVVQEPAANVDVIGGFRYLGLEPRTDWQLNATVTLPNTALSFARSGSVEKRENLWAAIVGAKGQVRLGASNWFVPYYVDLGGASDLFTWQGVLGLGYRFRWGDVRLDYRYLYYDQSGDKLIQDLAVGGFALGVNFRF